MLGLPESTEFNKRIPKQKFYNNLEISPALKKVFVDQVKAIYWRNKLATTTLNIASGMDVNEIEVFEVQITEQMLDEGILRQMDREIPYHILFLLEYQGKYQAWIGFKEASSSGTVAFKVNKYFHTKWLEENEMPVRIDGLNLDKVYENFVKQIAEDKLQFVEAGESLKEVVANEDEKESLRKKIVKLQAKIKKEKQLNKQMQLNSELKILKKQLEVL